MSKKYYLAGPMSGISRFNFPEFKRVAEALRGAGYEIISPAELDDPADHDIAMASMDGDPKAAGKKWSEFLARDVKIITDEVDGIIFLENWIDSKGARLEAFVGSLKKDFEFKQWNSNGLVSELSKRYVLSRIFSEVDFRV